MAGLAGNVLGEGISPLQRGTDYRPRISGTQEDETPHERNNQRAEYSRIEFRVHIRRHVPECLRYPVILGGRVAVHNDRGHIVHLAPVESASFCGPFCRRTSQFRCYRGPGFLKSPADSVGQPCMASNTSTGKKRRRRRRRLTDKIRSALARAASLGRRDVTEQRGSLYQARVEEELGHRRQRRVRDTHVEPRQARGSR